MKNNRLAFPLLLFLLDHALLTPLATRPLRDDDRVRVPDRLLVRQAGHHDRVLAQCDRVRHCPGIRAARLALGG